MGILTHFLAHARAALDRADSAVIDETKQLFGEALQALEDDVAAIKKHLGLTPPEPVSTEVSSTPTATPAPAPVVASTESTVAAPSPAPVEPAQAPAEAPAAAPAAQEVSQ